MEKDLHFYINLSLIFLIIFIRPKLKIFLFSSLILVIFAFIFIKTTETNRSGKLLIDRFTSNVINSTRIYNFFQKRRQYPTK